MAHFFKKKFFSCHFDSRVVNYERKVFIILTIGAFVASWSTFHIQSKNIISTEMFEQRTCHESTNETWIDSTTTMWII